MEILAIIWIICAVHNWGATLGYWAGEYPGSETEGGTHLLAIVMVATGPLGAIMVFFLSNYYEHGFRWRPW